MDTRGQDQEPAAPSAFRTRMLNLAREVDAAPDDDTALRIMREGTGLTLTDPDRDKAELDRRAAAAAERRPEAGSGEQA